VEWGQRYFPAPCPCGVVGSGAHGDCERLRQHAFWECAIAQAVRTQVQRGLGGALLQQRHLWLVDPPPSVYEIVWRVVVLAAIWAMEQGRKRLWSLVHTPPRQGSAVLQAISKPSTSFWSALHDFAQHDRPVPAKGWDEVGPDHPFLSVCIQVPLRLCLGLLGLARVNTAVGVSPETFLLHQVVGGSIPAVGMAWRPALAVWFDSTLCPGGCQRV
jgi:hypothetical protein